MVLKFEEVAKRSAIWGRAFFMGPSGSGKSRGAFEVATRMSGGDLPVTLINSERDREKLYADRYRYALINLVSGDDYSPATYIAALDLAEQRSPGGVIIIDSGSHEWMGTGGVLMMADRFGEWKTVRPKHNEFVQRILSCDSHVIFVCRAKMKYEVTEEPRPGSTGTRQRIAMLGVGPIQDGDLQYEFNLVGRFEQDTHAVTFSGHCDPLIDTAYDLVTDGQKVADTYSKWLAEGDPIVVVEYANEAEIVELRESLLSEGISAAEIDEKFANHRRENRGKLNAGYVSEQYDKSQARLRRKRGDQAPAEQQTEAAAETAGAAETGQETPVVA